MFIDTSGIPYWTPVNITLFWVIIGIVIALVILDILLSVCGEGRREYAGFFVFLAFVIGLVGLVSVFGASASEHSAAVYVKKVVELEKLGYTDVDLTAVGKFTANDEGAFVRGFLDYKVADTYEVFFVGDN